MTRDDIIRLTREAGAQLDKHGGGFIDQSVLFRFAALVAQHEREACALIVENEAAQYAEPVWALEIINDIRARGQT